MAKAFLVLRIHGQVDVPHWARTTLELLNLEKKFRATVIPDKDNTLGMLNKVKHYVCWQELDAGLAKELLDKKGRKSGYRKITDADFADTDYKNIEGAASALADGKISMSKLKPLKPWFAMAPPRRGFKRSTKRMYGQKGVLGANRDLAVLVRSMM